MYFVVTILNLQKHTQLFHISTGQINDHELIFTSKCPFKNANTLNIGKLICGIQNESMSW